MGWSAAQLGDWFEDFVTRAEATEACRAVAGRFGLADQADDLLAEWYLSVRTTVDRACAGVTNLPDGLGGEAEARAYVLRALRNDAIDLGRQRTRDRRFLTAGPGGRWGDALEPAHRPAAAAGPGAMGGVPGGFDEVDLHAALAGIAAALDRARVEGAPPCAGCRAPVPVLVAMAVVERLRFPGAAGIPGPAGAAAAAGPGSVHTAFAEERWDALVYEALEAVAPESMARAPGDHRRTAAARQFKRRCGGCARELLRALVVELGLTDAA